MALPVAPLHSVLPSVSVVVPTRALPHRRDRLNMALSSAGVQTLRPREIIVVGDGASNSEDAPFGALPASVADLVRWVPTGHAVGGAEARNIGVALATSTLVALLDDDDEWLPQKLEMQVQRWTGEHDVISCQVFAYTAHGQYRWPRQDPASAAHLSEYLFCRSSWRQGDSYLQTSTLLASRSLFQQVPFTRGLAQHQDWDWLLRAAQAGAQIHLVPQPLAIWRLDEGRPSVSRSSTWQASLAWAESRRELFTKRAYAGFLLSTTSAIAARERAYSGAPRILVAAFGHGRPRARDLALGLSYWIIPAGLRHRGRSENSRSRSR
jgi:GT2 family glycosyltransferase